MHCGYFLWWQSICVLHNQTHTHGTMTNIITAIWWWWWCLVAQSYLTLCDLRDCSLLPMDFSRQEYWSGMPFPPPGDLPNPGIESASLASSALAGGFFTTEPSGKPMPYGGSVQFSRSVVSDSFWPHEQQAARQASLSITNSWSPPKPKSIESAMPSNHLILCHPLLLLPSIFPSIRVFSNESAFRIRWPKYWSFSFSISPSNEYSGLISFRMDWLDLLAVQGTLKSLFQHHSSKASVFRCSAFFIVQLSHPYITTGKTIALTIWTFASKVMSLLFSMFSRFVIVFLPRSKCL